MTHEVRTYKNGKCVYQAHFQNAESAYNEYLDNIRLIKKYSKKGEETTVVRLNEGAVMAIETIIG